jgi:hypothetical protein
MNIFVQLPYQNDFKEKEEMFGVALRSLNLVCSYAQLTYKITFNPKKSGNIKFKRWNISIGSFRIKNNEFIPCVRECIAMIMRAKEITEDQLSKYMQNGK